MMWDRTLSIRSEAEEPVFLGKPVSPVIFRDLLSRLMLAVTWLHCFNFGKGSPALCCVPRGVTRHEFANQVRAFQHHAALCGLSRGFAKIAQESGLVHDLEDTLAIVN